MKVFKMFSRLVFVYNASFPRTGMERLPYVRVLMGQVGLG